MKILICNDGSEQAETAMRLGAAIAAGCRADVTLFGIIESPGKSPEILDSLRRGQALLEEKKIHAELLTKTGEPIREIIRRTTESPCDLVVVGATRKGRSRLFRLSSKTYKIIKEISPPVLAVAGKRAPTIKRVLVFSGGKRYREAAMRLTGEIARGLSASVTLLHVLPEVPGIYANLKGMDEPVSWLLGSHTELGQSLRREKEALESYGLAVEVSLACPIHRTHAATHESPEPAVPVHISHHVVHEDIGGARRARAAVGADHAIGRQREQQRIAAGAAVPAFELRQGAGRGRMAHLVPWGQVYQSFEAGRTGLTLAEIESNPPLERKGGAYQISRLDIVRISGYYDLASGQDSFDADPEPE